MGDGRRRERHTGNGPRLSLTSMVDVVFLLLVFFVLAIRPDDVLAKLTVSAAGGGTEQTIALGHIGVAPNGYALNDRTMSFEELRAALTSVSDTGTTRPLIIRCDRSAPHSALVRLLDLCAELGLKNLALTR
jgi:biopolymer transport protein ExbD